MATVSPPSANASNLTPPSFAGSPALSTALTSVLPRATTPYLNKLLASILHHTFTLSFDDLCLLIALLCLLQVLLALSVELLLLVPSYLLSFLQFMVLHPMRLDLCFELVITIRLLGSVSSQ